MNPSNLRHSGAIKIADIMIRWNANSFTGTSYVILSVNTSTRSTKQINAPSSAVRGKNSSIPPIASADPANIS